MISRFYLSHEFVGNGPDKLDLVLGTYDVLLAGLAHLTLDRDLIFVGCLLQLSAEGVVPLYAL